MISTVCVYNDRDILGQYLLPSLNQQTTQTELILVDNQQRRFKSAAEALNYGGRNARGEYIMFVHQDIRLESSTWIADAEKMLESLPKLGIAGVAGKRDRTGIVTNISNGITPRPAGTIRIDEATLVQTVDECLMIIPRNLFHRLPFDADVCDNWHLYAVDYSLSVGNSGLEVCVLPLPAHHRSGAYSMSDAYFVTLKSLLKKHKRNYTWIYTTMGDWYTVFPVNLNRFFERARGRLKLAAAGWSGNSRKRIPNEPPPTE
jgi:glycosyltransferase involved in cell wall biosynthesis